MRNTHVWSRLICVAFGLSLCGVGPSLAATWELVPLHPTSWRESSAFGVSGANVVGYLAAGFGDAQPVLWAGRSQVTPLTAPPETWAVGIHGSSIVGHARGTRDALLWQGAARELVQLEPTGADSSFALATNGVAQVGSVESHAAIWHGTAASVVDVHPPGAWASTLRAVDDSGEAGDIILGTHGLPHAALWHGTAESVMDLHPAGAYASQAQAISSGRQGGFVQFVRDGPSHAALWSGTAESFFDLTPSGGPTVAGAIYGMDGDVQVGQAGFLDGSGGATVWFGTPESAFFLGSLLSADYTETWAYAVDVDEFGTIRVVGSAYNNSYYLPDGTHYPRYEAMMWVLVPEPSSLAALAAGLAGLAAVRRRRRR